MRLSLAPLFEVRGVLVRPRQRPLVAAIRAVEKADADWSAFAWVIARWAPGVVHSSRVAAYHPPCPVAGLGR